MEESVTDSKSSEENGSSEFATPKSTSSPSVAPNNTPVSTPDLTPSRRSSRKKQSTFSSDFEYYSIGRKKETKEEKEEAADKESNQGEDEKGDAKSAAKKTPQGMQKKVAVRGRPAAKPVPKAANRNVKLKASLKKAKTTALKKSGKKKGKAKKESEEEEEEEEDEEEEEQDDDDKESEAETTPAKKSQKRKKTQPVIKRKKAKKKDDDDNDEKESSSSDEDGEDSTPISKLKEKIATSASDSKQQASSPSPAKKKISVLPPTSPLAKNLMSKLKKASMEVLSSPEGLLAGRKRKLSAVGKPETPAAASATGVGSMDIDEDEVPLKKLQVEKHQQKDVEVDPLVEAGLVKRSPSEIAKRKVVTKSKTESCMTGEEKPQMENETKPTKLIQPSGEVKEEKADSALVQTPKKEKVKTEENTEGSMKKKSGGEELVKKEMKEEKGEGSKKVEVKKSPVKKESNVVKKVMKVVKTADGRVIKGEVRILKDGRKVMVIDGKQKVLVTGKDKEKKQAASEQKTAVKKESVSVKKEEGASAGKGVKKVVKTLDGGGKSLKKEGGKVSPAKSKIIADAKKSSDVLKKTIDGQGGGKKVDDLLKRGVMVKKKRHQPFGNKATVAKIARNADVEEKPGKKRAASPKGAAEKKERKRSVEKLPGKKGEEAERRKSSETSSLLSSSSTKPHHSRDRSHSADSSKGEKRKSIDSSNAAPSSISSSSGSNKTNSEDAPPALTPANAVAKPHKHKHHHKPEQDTSMLDMTMNDLFKPDTMFASKKDQENDVANTSSTAGATTSNKEENVDKDEKTSTGDPDSPIKPQNLPNVLIEHRYSKPSSPVGLSENGEEEGPTGLGKQDLSSISIPTSTIVTDMTMPDIFMEESEASGKLNNSDKNEDVVAATSTETYPDNMAELQQMVKDDSETNRTTTTTTMTGDSDSSSNNVVVGDRTSILSSLDTELQEGGSDFLIVGQVEVERPSVVAVREEQVGEEVKSVVQTSSSSSSSTKVQVVKEEKVGDVKTKEVKSSSSTKDETVKKDHTKDVKTASKSSSSSSSLSLTSSSTKASTVKESKKEKAVSETPDVSKKKIKVKRQDSSSDGDGKVKKKKKVEPKDKGKDKEVKSDDSDEDEDDDFVDDENDDDWDDPTTLYCICKKPHGNRFMICCDKCEEWYHGSCVGVTRARGKEMDDNEEEYVCPGCQKTSGSTPAKPSIAATPVKPKSPSVTPSPTSSSSSSSVTKPLTHKCAGKKCSKTPRAGSVYCSNDCIMSHAQDALRIIRDEEVKRKSQEKYNQLTSMHRMFGSPRTLTAKATSSMESVMVIEKETGKVIQGASAPSYKNLRSWLEKHPTFQVFDSGKQRSSSSVSTLSFPSTTSSSSATSTSKDSKHSDKDKDSRHHSSSSSSSSHHHHHHRSSSTDSHSQDKKDDSSKSRRDSKDSTSGGTTAKKIDGDRRRSSSSASSTSSSSKADGSSNTSSSSTPHSSKSEEKRERDGPHQIRLNVRTAIKNSLSARADTADDIMLSGGEIKNLAVTIEEELYSLFMDTGHKYRTKYRSLIFNIKDSKNKGLFRKILTGKIKPYKLVQMSTEELASRELAKWREKESKHQLEMIEQSEKEALKKSLEAKHVRKKTHKGEVEVEDEDLSILETRLEEKPEKVPDTPDEMIQVPVIDTTDQHRAHLFDLNCKVCTGRIVPGPEEQQLSASTGKKVTFSFEASTTKIISDDEQTAEPEQEPEQEDFAKAEEIVKEAMRTVQKTSEAVSSRSPPPPTAEDSPPDVNMPESPPPGETTSLLARSLSPKHDSVVSSSSSSSSTSKVVVRSPDSALQSGLEVKAQFVPTGPLLWKGCISMLDVSKFFTSAYRVSGPFENITIPDTIHIMGRISPDHMWDYLSKIRQAGSKDLTVVRFIPGSDDEKVAYVHLFSYLNSRGRCGVAGSDNSKQIKDFYVIPLASHSKIPRTLMPFDGPGLEENRPHMLIGIIVKQRGKHSDSPTTHGTSSSSSSKSKSSSKSSSSSSSSSSKHHHGSSSSKSSSSSKHRSSGSNGSGSSSSKDKKPVVVNRDPRLAKLAAAAKPQPSPSPTGSTSSAGSSSHNSSGTPNADSGTLSPSSNNAAASGTAAAPVDPRKGYGVDRDPRKAKKAAAAAASVVVEAVGKKEEGIYESEYIPTMPVKTKAQPVAEYVPTVKKKDKGMDSDDDSEPYSPGKEAEPYSPSQEAQADEPYDPADESLMDESGIPLTSTTTTTTLPQQQQPSSSTSTSSSLSSTLSKSTKSSSIPAAVSAVAVSLPSTVSGIPATTTTTTTTTKTQQESLKQRRPVSAGAGVSSTAVTAGVVKSDVKSTAKTVTAGKDKPFSIEDCVEKMAGSNNPTEISSLMVTALSTASSPEEQQKLLVNLTKRVEERKLQLANLLRAAGTATATTTTAASTTAGNNASSTNTVAAMKQGDSESSISDRKLADSTSDERFDLKASSLSSKSSNNGDKQSSMETSNVASSSTSETQPKGFGFSFTKSWNKTTPPLLSSTTSANVFDADNVATSVVSGNAKEQDQSQSSSSSSSSSKPQIPDALKALMDDVLGNTQSKQGGGGGESSGSRMKQLMKKETGKSVARALEEKKMKEEDSDGETDDGKGKERSEKTEAERRLEDEMEAQKILEQLNESEKAIGLPGGGKKEVIPGLEDAAGSAGTGESKKDKVPTIDELLEKLKKGGFQFPATTTNPAVSASDTTIGGITSSGKSVLPENNLVTSSSGNSSLPLPPVTSCDQDVDLRNTGAGGTTTAVLLSTVTSTMGMAENPTPADTIAACLASLPKNQMGTATTAIPSSSTQDVDHRKQQQTSASLTISSSSSNLPSSTNTIDLDRDDRAASSSSSFYQQDRDDRYFSSTLPTQQSSSSLTRPKNPLDPRAFPPLPGEPTRSLYPPPPSSSSSSHFPPRPLPTPQLGRAQPPPPGTEFEPNPAPSSSSAELPRLDMDVDMRGNLHHHHRGGAHPPIPPPLPPEQAPPPLPPQPPPPLPPLPGNRGGGEHPHPHPAPPLPPGPYHQHHLPPPNSGGYPPTGDVDFRSHQHHPHPNMPPTHPHQQHQPPHPHQHHPHSQHHHSQHHHNPHQHPPPHHQHPDNSWYHERERDRERDRDRDRNRGGDRDHNNSRHGFSSRRGRRH